MEILTQNLKDGKMEILEVPFPSCGKGQVLVRNHFSVISAGTEGKTVTDARKGYIAKARSRQKEVKQVIEMVKTQGVWNTYNLVMNKLEAPNPLGYSCAGEVIAVGNDIYDIKVGDFVACGGQGAYHADIVSVYRNLCVKVPPTVDLRHAAFSTIASIAIQGVRQADLRFGETCVVIGLGLIGQITVQILNAAGIKAVGIDVDTIQVKAAIENGAALALNRREEGVEKIIQDFTEGIGSDAVIITAGTNSTDPVDFAGLVSRKKGKVVIVGAVPTGFARENYFKKELELKMSSSYGPGRYDTAYEEKGQDYPVGYVRWTENRNMKSFIDLLESKRVDLDKVITHTFSLENSPEAYSMILERSERFAGILIKYDFESERALKQTVETAHQIQPNSNVKIGFIGAGSFATNMLLPKLKGKQSLIGVTTSRGNTSRYVADKFGFKFCTDNANELIQNSEINTYFICTRHNSHASYVLKCLENKKNVFVEKPLAMSVDDLNLIKEAYSKTNTSLLVGFNRRFSPLTVELKKRFNPQLPKAITLRINAGAVPKDHWVNDPEIGGGRIIGEVCHFIDLAAFMSDSKIENVHAFSIVDPDNLMDTIVVNLEMENGSVANISYFSNGEKSVAKERIEVFCNKQIAKIDDFLSMEIVGGKEGNKKIKLQAQDKGHEKELEVFIQALKEGKPAPISFEELYNSTLATLAVIESIKLRTSINLEKFALNSIHRIDGQN